MDMFDMQKAAAEHSFRNAITLSCEPAPHSRLIREGRKINWGAALDSLMRMSCIGCGKSPHNKCTCVTLPNGQ